MPQYLKTTIYIINFDGVLKSRHSGENRSPDQL